MFRLGNRWPSPPVVPGPAGITRGPAPACDACGNVTTNRALRVIGPDTCGILCVDAGECAKRYRGGTSPASYAAGLRGELLGVAP